MAQQATPTVLSTLWAAQQGKVIGVAEFEELAVTNKRIKGHSCSRKGIIPLTQWPVSGPNNLSEDVSPTESLVPLYNLEH